MAPSWAAFLADAPGHVAETRAGDGLAFNAFAEVLQHVLQIVHRTVAGGLGTNQAAAVAEALAGQHAVLEGTLQAAVLTVQIADLPGAHAHVAGGHVHVGPDVAIQRLHEALAEAHDLRVGLAGGGEVTAALAAANGQAGQGILEDLLKSQELHGAQVHVLLEAQAALVGADGAVELAAVAGVGVPGAIVGHPHHPEADGALGLHHPVQQVGLFILGVLLNDRFQRGQDLLHSLYELRFIGILGFHVFDDAA